MKYKLIKKEEKWYCKWIDTDGKRHQKLCRECRTEKQAKETAERLVKCNNMYLFKTIAREMYIPGSAQMERLEMFGRKLAPETVRNKRTQLDFFLRKFGDYDIRTLRPSEIELFLLGDKSHSGSFKNNLLDTILSVYEETTWKCDKQIPAPKFQRFKRNSKKADVFTKEELEIFLAEENWPKYEYFIFFNLMASCGLRIGEARAVRPCQFLWEDNVLVVDGFCKLDGTRTNYNKKGSDDDRKIRIAPLPNRIAFLVRKFIDRENISDGEFVFRRKDGSPFNASKLDRAFRLALKRAGISKEDRKLIPHSLRFTYVTEMRSSVDIEQVRKIVGHSSPDMTEYYTRFSLEHGIKGISGSFEAVNRLFGRNFDTSKTK